MPGLAPPLLPSLHCRNSPSPVSIPPWKYSLPLPPLPCPREGGDPSHSVMHPPPVSSRRRGPIPFPPPPVLAKAGTHPPSVIPPPVSSRKAGTHPLPSFPLPCPREGGDPSPSVVPPPVSSRRRGPIPSVVPPPYSPLLPQSPLISPTFTKKRIRISKSVNFRHKIIKNCPYSITKSNQLQAQTLESKSSKQLFVFKKQPPSNVILNEPKNLTLGPLRPSPFQLPIDRPYRIMTILVVLLLLKRSRHGNWQG